MIFLMPHRHLEAALKEIDSGIRSGRGAAARHEIQRLSKDKIPRKFAVPLATLARRADVPLLGLRILNPIVRPTRKVKCDPSSDELVEYAFCLTNSGCHQEALKTLETVNPEQSPQAWLAKTFSLVAQWNYGATIDLLRAYCEAPLLNDYQRLVGRANLVAALVWEQKEEEAETLLSSLLDQTMSGGHHLLHGKLLSLRAQNVITCHHWDKAKEYLSAAEAFLAPMHGLDHLLIRKWHAAYDLQRSRDATTLKALRAIRTEGLGIQHWETVRHCDYLEAIICKDEKLVQRVYFGTPYASFRDRLLKDFGGKVRLPENYLWSLGEKGVSQEMLDILQSESNPSIKLGQALHRTLQCLASDFYRPLRVSTIHYAIYPEEFYNPFSSPWRVHQILKRLRQKLKRDRVPLRVIETGGLYSLGAIYAVKLKVPKEIRFQPRDDFQLQRLRLVLTADAFTVREAAKALGIAQPTALKLLQGALAKESVERNGKGRATTYRFPNQKVA